MAVAPNGNSPPILDGFVDEKFIVDKDLGKIDAVYNEFLPQRH